MERLDNLGSRQELHDFVDIHLRLREQSWMGALSDVAVTLTFGKHWFFLCASVLVAALVRLNPAGPAKLQLVLSSAAAFYCVLISVVWLAYLLVVGWWLLLALGAAGAFVWFITRR
ncbi:hypothetical protein ACFFTU_27150 [Streptomyces cremeus]|uniref:Uncharacterized protein n=1 Tax=Streptomyces cremeus TaxID=66881 RepID=A0ABV5PK86_STRCM